MTEYGERSYDKPTQATVVTPWAAYAFCFFATVVVFFFILIIVYASRFDHFNNHFPEQFHAHFMKHYTEMGLDRRGDPVRAQSTPVLTLFDVLRDATPHTIKLCHLNAYCMRGDGDTNNQTLQPVVGTMEQLMKLQQNENDEMSAYVLSVRLRIEYNVNTSAFFSSAKIKMNGDGAYMTLAYNVTSNYMDFSTIELQELEFNVDERAVRPIRTLTLCTNNIELANSVGQVARCNKMTTSGLLTLSGARLLPLTSAFEEPATAPSASDRQTGTQTRAPTRAPAPTPTPTRSRGKPASGAMAGFDIMTNDPRQHGEQQKDEIFGIRAFYMIFYKESKATQKTKETTLLTVEPVEC